MDTTANPFDTVRKVGYWSLIVVTIVFVYLIFVARNLEAITDVDALDYAQVARNVAEGKGYTTDFLKPLSLTRVRQIQDHPELTFGPVHIWVTSVFIRALGASKQAVALASGVPFLATILLTYYLGLMLFDKRTAILAAALFGGNLLALNLSISGYEVSLMGLLVTLLIMDLYLVGERPEWRRWLIPVAGLLLGLIGLTKEVWGIALIPAYFYLWHTVEKGQRAKSLLIMLGVSVLVWLPWGIHLAKVAGNPFFSWRWYEINMHTQTNPGATLYRTYAEGIHNPLTFVFQHPLEMVQKLRDGADMLYPMLALVGGFYTVAFFLVGVMVPLGTLAFERLRYVMYAAYLLLFGLLMFLTPTPRMAYPLAPIISLVAAALFYRVLRPIVSRYDPRKQMRLTVMALAVLLLAHVFPLLSNLTRMKHAADRPLAVTAAPLCTEVADITGGAPIISDVPWFTAWYGHQPSLWTPRSLDDLDRLQTDVGQIEYLLLTPVSAQLSGSERTEAWASLWAAARAGQPVAERGFVVFRKLSNDWILMRKVSMIPGRPATGLETGGSAGGG